MKKLSSLQSSRNEDRSLKNVQEPIPGLFIYEDFITEDEEAAILNFLNREDNLPWKAAKFNGKNNGKRWGVHCNLRDRRVDAPENPLPDFILNMLIPKLKRLSCTKGCIPNEANAIQYYREKGDWLHPHVDDRKLSKEPIANLSLAGDCIMTFTNQAMHRNLAVKEEKVLLKRRCLQVLTGKARYDFSHGIQNQDLLSDWRVSVTMRESPLTSS
jgi:alkylated DNA repair dioxygenase AlkB